MADDPVATAATCAARRHGDEVAYQVDRCRCPTARAAQSRYAKRRRCTPQPGTVDATGTRRRIRALMALGWPRREVMRRVGLVDDKRLVVAARVRAATARRVARVYEEMSAHAGPSKQVRSYARNRGYAQPLAWDDIDDPKAKPQGVVGAR